MISFSCTRFKLAVSHSQLYFIHAPLTCKFHVFTIDCVMEEKIVEYKCIKMECESDFIQYKDQNVI